MAIIYVLLQQKSSLTIYFDQCGSRCFLGTNSNAFRVLRYLNVNKVRTVSQKSTLKVAVSEQGGRLNQI